MNLVDRYSFNGGGGTCCDENTLIGSLLGLAERVSQTNGDWPTAISHPLHQSAAEYKYNRDDWSTHGS